MHYIKWKHNKYVSAATVLRSIDLPSYGDTALHTSNINDVLNNRMIVSDDWKIPLDHFVFAQQTHSDHFYKVTKLDCGKGTRIYEEGINDCDALYTKESNIALGVFHADCVPILLYDPITHLIAAIHSGWQGTVKEITKKLVTHLIQEEGVNPKNLEAYIGPAIAYQSFEVGMDVVKQVQAMSFDTSPYITYKANDKALVDNKMLNVQMLKNLGVPNENITIDKNDTFMPNASFFSYRRDKHCGRHMSFIIMRT